LGFLLSAVGYIVLFVALLIGLAAALHLPMLVAAGVPELELSRELDEVFGYSGWPMLVERIAFGLCAFLALMAAAFIIFGRRKGGAAHIIRAAVGTLGLFFCLLTLSDLTPPRAYSDSVIVDMLKNGQVGPAIERFLGYWRGEPAVFAGIIFIVSVIVLAWPPRRREDEFARAIQSQGVSS
jgi:hypothetical protein